MDAATHLVRALSNSFDDFNQPKGGVEPCEALRGIVELLESIGRDLSIYFDCLSPSERESMKAWYGARRRMPSRKPPAASDANGNRAEEGATH